MSDLLELEKIMRHLSKTHRNRKCLNNFPNKFQYDDPFYTLFKLKCCYGSPLAHKDDTYPTQYQPLYSGNNHCFQN